MALIRVKKEEGHYTIKLIDKIPKKGNANWLYALRSDKINEFYKWNIFSRKYDIISIGTTPNTVIEEGNNIIITGIGTAEEPYIINANNSASTGLEAIDEGNGIGYRIIGRDPLLYSTIGENAVDFGTSDAAAPIGASGDSSFVVGVDNTAFGYGSTAIGESIKSLGSFSTSFGEEHLNEQYATAIFGFGNTALSGSHGYSLVSGRDNNLIKGFGNHLLGTALLLENGVGVTIVGTANAEVTAVTSTVISENPVFIIGNGDHGLEIGNWNDQATTRRNAFVVKQGGEATFNSLTKEIIDAEPTGRVALTREWLLDKQYEIKGIRESNTNVSGTIISDLDMANVFDYTLTGNTIWEINNLPSGVNARVFEAVIRGDYSLDLPITWVGQSSNHIYSGTVSNHIIVSVINGTTGSEIIYYTLTNMPI